MAQCHWNSSGTESGGRSTECVYSDHLLVERCPSRRRLGGLGMQAGRDSRKLHQDEQKLP